jgi:hypothetical protein
MSTWIPISQLRRRSGDPSRQSASRSNATIAVAKDETPRRSGTQHRTSEGGTSVGTQSVGECCRKRCECRAVVAAMNFQKLLREVTRRRMHEIYAILSRPRFKLPCLVRKTESTLSRPELSFSYFRCALKRAKSAELVVRRPAEAVEITV